MAKDRCVARRHDTLVGRAGAGAGTAVDRPYDPTEVVPVGLGTGFEEVQTERQPRSRKGKFERTLFRMVPCPQLGTLLAD